MKKKLLPASLLLAVLLTAFLSPNRANSAAQEATPLTHHTPTEMKSYISIFEIAASDFARAVKFYQAILDIQIEEMDMQGARMGLFPSEGQTVAGVIIQSEGYVPSAEGVTIYLNGGEDLQLILDKVEANGGKTMVPKTLIDEENGYFAWFLDTEGNRIGLHSLH